jgi:hypothetical protein
MSESSSDLGRRNSKGWKFWTKLFVALIFLFAVLLFFSPSFHDTYFGVAKNESAAVGSLRKITTLETQYAAEHSNKGFACELPLLRPIEKLTDAYDPIAALLSGEWSGYKFAVVDCSAESNGIVTHYGVTAVPTNPGRSGIRAFCTDQSGQLYYSNEASASKCVATRQALSD